MVILKLMHIKKQLIYFKPVMNKPELDLKEKTMILDLENYVDLVLIFLPLYIKKLYQMKISKSLIKY